MKSKIPTIILLFIFISTFIFVGKLIFNKSKSQGLITSNLKTESSEAAKKQSTPTLPPAGGPSPTPVIFHFDKSTNLKEELNTINPEVKDDDFLSLKKTISSF